ncbi:MAG: signal peptidase I [Chloroflexi bacterium]|nr:signal peptidase I [Chloroflexota bacterium]
MSLSVPEQTLKKKPSALLELLRTGLEALAVFLVLTYLTGRFEIHQVSMEPNFHEGQRVVVSRLEMLWPSWLVDIAEAAGEPRPAPVSLQRGQIVVLYRSDDRAGDPLIKRVVGLPGDTLELRDGGVYVNGQRLDEPYLHGLRTPCLTSCTPTTLGDDEYFVMGDNRPNSMDSRSFGSVRGDQIIGRVFLRYWPLNQLALFP